MLKHMLMLLIVGFISLLPTCSDAADCGTEAAPCALGPADATGAVIPGQRTSRGGMAQLGPVQDVARRGTAKFVTKYYNGSPGGTIQIRWHSKTRSGIAWPSQTKVWLSPKDGKWHQHAILCNSGEKICLGARSNLGYWGVDIDNSETCSDCCYKCEPRTLTVTFH